MTDVKQLRRLVGNPDAYAVQRKDGQWRPMRAALTDAILQSHLAKVQTVGTYINVKDKTRLLVVDIDTGEEYDADALAAALMDLDVPFSSIGKEFSGRKGYHIWVPLQDWYSAHDVRRLGRYAVTIAGLDPSTEVFPKQDEVRDLGNLVKLPEGVHQVTGQENPMLGRWPLPLGLARLQNIIGELPVEARAKRPVSETRFPCMEAIQEEGAQEGSRNIQLYHLAAMLRRAGVSENNVDIIVNRANSIGDPVDEEEVRTILDSSSHGGPICAQLPEERRCGELCIMERTKGLFTRPGQLRHAGVGENVVVTLSGRPKANVVEFEHDDVGKMKAVLRGH